MYVLMVYVNSTLEAHSTLLSKILVSQCKYHCSGMKYNYDMQSPKPCSPCLKQQKVNTNYYLAEAAAVLGLAVCGEEPWSWKSKGLREKKSEWENKEAIEVLDHDLIGL